MQDWLFFIFAGLTLIGAALTVANPFSRSPVTSAMFLVVTILSLAGLFVLLHAFFLAAVQILIYAGAVIVLFLFVIMLLNLPQEEKRKIQSWSLGLGSIGMLVVIGIMARAMWESSSAAPSPLRAGIDGNATELGKLLFTQFLLPFEIVSVLLLVAIVGVLLMSKKETQ